ncbi:elongation factor G-like protein EF-G2 [Streptomyces alkaliterrae]|uniref:Elongation factor G-like protein EF-G2 n=1 Tax=Streptomyces alkaliterrae TaxID=2213162 RepID=A0A5P0YQ34_9ACTN|nr:elongation factor G-like protein EF-G2 [Streptomyces alkaliterrae]MBB1260387.1 elongation factor G-like protein EF-G2 [Streptomyces alkaliterrae]MQS02474.1 elongation factor G-like protein EF-G2 [Streptomyces alkaliterrae]
MGDRNGTVTQAPDRVREVADPEGLRNVALVGPSGSGKTTLAEALARASGALSRSGRVEDGTTVSDHDEIEQRQGRSVQLSVVPLDWDGLRINLLDTPGHADFLGELRAGLRAADAALFVISAADGVDAGTRALWRECAAVGTPRAIVLTHLDAVRADFDEMVALCRDAFGGADPDAVLPLHLPITGEPGADGHPPVTGLAALLTGQVVDYSAGRREVRPPQDGEVARLAGARERLIEGVIAESEDEALMDRYAAGAEVDAPLLVTDLEKAVARAVFHPVLVAAPAAVDVEQALGTVEVLELVARGFPTPRERALPPVTTTDGEPRAEPACDPSGPLVAEVVRLASDPYVGRVALVRVFSGTLRPDTPVHVCGHGLADRGHEDHDLDVRVGALTSPFGRHQRPLGQAVAGDLACVARLTGAETGDTLSDRADPLLMPAWELPDPLLPVPVRAHGKADEDRFSQGLAKLAAEDPTLRVEQNPATGQVVLWCLGEAHRDVALERLRGRFGVRVDTEEHRVELRETFAGPAAGRGRHVKQSGGHGQYAVCEITVEPLPVGSGIEFVDEVVGGAVPRQFIPSVEKGVRARAAAGLRGERPLVDVRVTLKDGKAHSVDSSDAAFQTAGALALREAAQEAGLRLLEPVAEVGVTVADEYVGAVLSDLSARRGRVLGTEQQEGGSTWVRAEVPERELGRYAVELRSLAHGSGAFTRRHLRHEPVPQQLAARMLEAAG